MSDPSRGGSGLMADGGPSHREPCRSCGRRLWVSDWPGPGRLCASAWTGRLLCDRCATTEDRQIRGGSQ